MGKKITGPRVTQYTSGGLYRLAHEALKRTETDFNEAVVCLVMSAFAFKAFFNDVVDAVKQGKRPGDPAQIHEFVSISEKLEEQRVQLPAKVEFAYFILTQRSLDKGALPFQDFRLLVNVRNRLVHKRPETYPVNPDLSRPAQDHDRLIVQMADRGVITRPSERDPALFMESLMHPSVARWALDTSMKMARFLLEAMPPSSVTFFMKQLFKASIEQFTIEIRNDSAE